MSDLLAAVAPPLVNVRDLVKSYDGRRVLDGFDLSVERGETLSSDARRARFALVRILRIANGNAHSLGVHANPQGTPPF